MSLERGGRHIDHGPITTFSSDIDPSGELEQKIREAEAAEAEYKDAVASGDKERIGRAAYVWWAALIALALVLAWAGI